MTTKIDYSDIKNYIHNYLKISKKDIKDAIWEAISETINQEVKKALNDRQRIEAIVEGQIKYEISCENRARKSYIHSTMDEIYNRIDTVIHEEVLKRLQITLKEPSE